MRAYISMSVVVCAAIGGLLFVRPAAAELPSDTRLEKVFADWQARRERIKTIRYRTSGEHILSKGSLISTTKGSPVASDALPHDVSWPVKMVMLLDFTTNRHRLVTDEQPYSEAQKKNLPRYVTTTVFANKELWTLNSRPDGIKGDKNNPDVYIASGNMRGEAFPSEYWPFFLGHGIVSLITQQHILPGRLNIAPKKDVYHIKGEGNFANRACVVLRTEAQEYGNTVWDELWIDPEHESAVLRQASYANGKIVADLQIDYQKTAGGWLPQSWTISHADNNGVVFSLDRMRVDELEIDPVVSDADFRLDITPGMIVKRTSFPGEPDQISVPNPKSAGPTLRVGQDGSLNVINGPEPNSLWRFYLGWATVFVLAVGTSGAFWLWKRNRKSLPPV